MADPVRYDRNLVVVPRKKACHRCLQPFTPKQNPYWCDSCVEAANLEGSDVD